MTTAPHRVLQGMVHWHLFTDIRDGLPLRSVCSFKVPSSHDPQVVPQSLRAQHGITECLHQTSAYDHMSWALSPLTVTSGTARRRVALRAADGGAGRRRVRASGCGDNGEKGNSDAAGIRSHVRALASVLVVRRHSLGSAAGPLPRIILSALKPVWRWRVPRTVALAITLARLTQPIMTVAATVHTPVAAVVTTPESAARAPPKEQVLDPAHEPTDLAQLALPLTS